MSALWCAPQEEVRRLSCNLLETIEVGLNDGCCPELLHESRVVHAFRAGLHALVVNDITFFRHGGATLFFRRVRALLLSRLSVAKHTAGRQQPKGCRR